MSAPAASAILSPLPGGVGASFLPAHPSAAGERVTVRALLRRGGRA